MSDKQQFFATSPKGLELLLVDELKSFGAEDAAEKLAGVTFTGNIEVAYRACLWSRLANRVLMQLSQRSVENPDELYQAVQQVDWTQHLDVDGTFAVHAVCAQSNITHSLFAAQKSKDAIVDQFRDNFDKRPNVDKVHPHVSVYIYLYRNTATIYLDLSGESLHRRGYRIGGGRAPLKENLAAAILIRAGWPAIAKAEGALYDPMCGSGTLLIEAALMAAEIAPGLNRDYYGFTDWKQHQPKIWQAIYEDALARKEQGLSVLPEVVGFDHDAEAIKIAFENIERAGLTGQVHVEKRELDTFKATSKAKPGLVVVNPPYGERLGDVNRLTSLYRLLGSRLKDAFQDWQAAVFTGNPDLGKDVGLHSHKRYALFNGDINCKLLLFSVEPANFIDQSPTAENKRRIVAARKVIGDERSETMQMFCNRVRKSLKHLRKKAKREKLEIYRVYDADLPDYQFAIDVDGACIRVLEYAAPETANSKKVSQRRSEVLAVLPEVFEVDLEQVYYDLSPAPKPREKT